MALLAPTAKQGLKQQYLIYLDWIELWDETEGSEKRHCFAKSKNGF